MQLDRRPASLKFATRTGEPHIVVGDLATQPCFQKWTFSYFKQLMGDFPVTVADDIISPTVRLEVRLDQYLAYVEGEADLPEFAGRPQAYLWGFRPFETRPELLSDVRDPAGLVNLFEQIDPATRELLCRIPGCPPGRWIFLGKAGTVSRLHQDYSSAWIAQVSGVKKVTLISPKVGCAFFSASNDLVIDLKDKVCLASAGNYYEDELRPGETLIIPSGWWHRIEALTPCITVSFNILDRFNFGTVFARILSDLRSTT